MPKGCHSLVLVALLYRVCGSLADAEMNQMQFSLVSHRMLLCLQLVLHLM